MDHADKFLLQWFQISEVLIDLLKANGNVCNDWSRVVFHSEKQALSWSSRIKNCTFSVEPRGFIAFLERWNESISQDFDGRPAGVYDTTFTGTCVICAGCRIAKTDLMSHVVVYPGALVQSCGEIIAKKGVSGRGNGTTVTVGPENGGRSVQIFAGMGFVDACMAAFGGASKWSTMDIDSEVIGGGDNMTLILSNAVVKQCPRVVNCYLGPSAVVEAACMENCTMNSEVGRPTLVSSYANVSNSILEAASSVTEHSLVTCSYLAEASAVSAGASLDHVILGPDSSIARGECHHSLVGPFVGFHHQSLLIAALWPLGRGNVAHGAMLGSNHTGKVNDQECWMGEGCFFGLGVAVKFPCNFAASPYSLFAAKCTINPMRLDFPFSLILPDSGDPSKVIIKPGWGLHANPYMLERAMKKFKMRRKAQNHATGQPILRRSIVLLVEAARRKLNEGIRDGSISLGRWANIVGIDDIVEGERAYRNFLRRYALHGVEVVNAFYYAHGLHPHAHTEESVAPEIPSNDGIVSIMLEDIQKMIPSSTSGVCRIPGSRPGRDFLRVLFPEPALAQPALHAMAGELESKGVLTDTQLSTIVHQWSILEQEYPTILEIFERACTSSTSIYSRDAMERAWEEAYCLFREALYELECDYATAVKECKMKDDVRGSHVIPDYIDVNKAMQEQLTDETGEGMDTVMREARSRAEKFRVGTKLKVVEI